ncbi:hypothetical protein TREVI0001_1287 [Treponema vincentii ATCC 35580]|uniref:Uncharacterized protein n=1 Tax=Treponema vincentii ATCC 35580 TaxID=596324 RepID=C8PSC0_9SPIR|nr:hypothetical protein TREVI0001_1287 [Treponema vincentii ATCC 35580]
MCISYYIKERRVRQAGKTDGKQASRKALSRKAPSVEQGCAGTLTVS